MLRHGADSGAGILADVVFAELRQHIGRLTPRAGK